MHFLLRSDMAQVDYGFAAYSVRVESLFSEVDDLVTYLIVTFNDKTTVRVDQHVAHQKGLHATVRFFLVIRGVNVLRSTYKTVKFCYG